MKITLLGPYPPPYGGISVHVQRLKKKLEERAVPCIVYDYSGICKREGGVVMVNNKATWLLSQLFDNTDNIIHCCGYSPSALTVLSILAIVKRKEVILDAGGFLFGQEGIASRHRFAFKMAARAGIYFIAESSRSKDIILSLGIKPENVNDEIIPCFIPPEVEAEGVSQLPDKIQSFINNHGPIITANAFRISFYNNEDLYGIDLCIDLCANLKLSHPNVGFILCISTVGDYDYLSKVIRRTREKGIEDNFLFASNVQAYHDILTRSDVFIRPTNTDGDSVSLREALYLRVPSVASDAVPRPDSAILFRNRDVADLTSKVEHILGNYGFYKTKLEAVKIEDNTEKILRVYRRLERSKRRTK